MKNAINKSESIRTLDENRGPTSFIDVTTGAYIQIIHTKIGIIRVYNVS